MVIICDRFIDSTIAYQVLGKKVEANFIQNIHKTILDGLKPNLTFILKVSLKSSKIRLSKRKVKIDMTNLVNPFIIRLKNLS